MAYPRQWFRSYALLMKWQALRLKPLLPLLIIIQLLIGVGMVIGLRFLVPELDSHSAMFLATGGPTLTLIALGLVLVPQFVADAKSQGTFEYMWSLPAPRMAFLAADLSIWLIVALPGVVLALLVGSWRYDFVLQVSPLAVPAFFLVVLTATAIGYAIAYLSPKPDLVIVITNFMVFCLFLFSPINFPVERLPGWLAELHRFLPVKYAADVVRGTLTDAYGIDLQLAFTVLGIWCLAGVGVTYIVVSRRR